MRTDDDLHPADRLIHDFIAQPRTATTEEIRRITDRVATVSFNDDKQRVPEAMRGLTLHGTTLDARADALTVHLFKRVLIERQWSRDTTAAAYLESLHTVARLATARVALYRQWDTRDVAAIIAETATVIARDHLGSGSERYIIVVYEATRGIIVTGYQFSSLTTVTIPEDALWLR